MIEHWPWYVSGAALASIPVIHWLGLHRTLAVSGRVTALVNRLRFGKDEPEVEISSEELLAAMREATLAAFGTGAVETPSEGGEEAKLPSRLPPIDHIAFLGAMILGGFVSAMLSGAYEPAMTLQSSSFTAIFGDSPAVMAGVLGFGGILVGFGTRMAGGCTTGHGLCGVSRFQKGSLLATGAFFGAAVAVSLVLRGLA
jgi:hypothetical protein